MTTSSRQWTFDICVTKGFVLTEFAAVADALRTSNRVVAQPVFDWRFVSHNGGEITSSSGAMIKTRAFEKKPQADYLFVIGNTQQDQPDLSMGHVIDRYTNRGAQVFLLAEAASRYINDRGGSLPGASTHWENSAVLRERTGVFEADDAIASQHGQIVTCAGMGTTLDVVLAVIGRHISQAALMTVANIFLHERIRDFGTRQPYGGTSGTVTGDEVVDRATELMLRHIEEPLLIVDIAAELKLSVRALERRFARRLGCAPKAYYRQIRLAQANNLLLNTSLSMREIGLACGFPSGFSVLYKAQFGVTPLVMRRQRKSSG